MLATAPVWEALPEVNRLAVSRLLGLLVERMVQAAVVSGGSAVTTAVAGQTRAPHTSSES